MAVTPGVGRQSRLLETGSIVELYQLDLTILNGPIYYYHNYPISGGRVVTDMATTLNSAIVTSNTASFTNADVGALVTDIDATSTGVALGQPARILSVQSGTQATLNKNSTATKTNVAAVIGSGVIFFQGKGYTPYPISGDGWDRTTKGALPRPSVIIGNIGGAATALMQQYNDFVGATVTRKRTYSIFLDEGSSPNSTEEYEPDIFVVMQKRAEDNTKVTFTLATKMDSEGVTLPSRQIIANACQWFYRGPDCGYAGEVTTDQFGNGFGAQFTDGVLNGTTTLTSATASFTSADTGRTITGDGIPVSTTITFVNATTITLSNAATITATNALFTIVGRVNDRGLYNSANTYAALDKTYTLVQGVRVYWISQHSGNTDPLTNTTSWKMDVCNKQLSDCRKHFGPNNALPTSAFPGSNQIIAG